MEVRFEATEKQWLMLQYWQDDITTEIGFWWAAWWWKSMWWVFAVRSSCMKYPWSKRVFGRKELVNLKRTTLATYYKMLKEYNIPQQYYWVLNWNTNIIKFPNWSEIVLLDCASQPSDPEFTRFWSLELTWAFIDESNEVDAKWLTILKTRLWRQNEFKINGGIVRIKPKLLETFNPNKWHVYEDYYKPRKDWTLPSYRKFIPSLAKDNPYLSESYIQQLERSDEMTKQRLLYWNFEYDDTPWKVFRWDEISDLFTNIIEKDETPYITCDVARLWNDRTIIYVWNWLESVLIKEFKWYTTDQTANVIKDLEQQYRVSRYNICVDSDWVWCLTKWTEVMTKDWWISVENLKVWTQLYSKDKDGNVCIETINEIIEHEDNVVIEAENWYKFSRWHFLPVKTRKEHNVQMYSWDHIMQPWNWKRPKSYLLQNDFNWKWKDFTFVSDDTLIEMPNWWYNVVNNWRTIEWVKLARLLWWFISEWYFDGRYFCVCQSIKSPFNDEIDSTISDCWLKATKVQKWDEYFWKIWNKPLFEFIKKECYIEWTEEHIAPAKKVPEFIKMWTKDIINAFLDAYRKWDWYIHKWSWMPYYSTSSKQLAEDVLELIYKKWWYWNIMLHEAKWSKSTIEWRIIERKQDVWCIYEYKNKAICIGSKVKKEYLDTVYELRISWDSKLFMNRFADKRWFRSHNWWVADQLRWCVNFMNNWQPILEDWEIRNYWNLKAQCYFKLKEVMEKRQIRVNASWQVKEDIQRELDNIIVKNMDSDQKIRLESKEDMKKRLWGNSPDYADALMMRMYWLLKRKTSPIEKTEVYTINFDDMLY